MCAICIAIASLFERKPCRQRALGLRSCGCGRPPKASSSRCGVGLSYKSATDTDLPVFADNLRANEMRLKESKPALSNVASMSIEPAISVTTSSSHSLRSPPCSSSTVTMCPPSASHSSMLAMGSQRGNSTRMASGQTTSAIAITAGEAEMTTCAPCKSPSPRAINAPKSGTQTTPPFADVAPRAARRACVTRQPAGPLTAVGLAGSTGVSSMPTNTLPTWMPFEKYSKALLISEIWKVFVGNRGKSGRSRQTSSSSCLQRSGCLSISTSKCAAEYVRPDRKGARPSRVSSYWSRFPNSMKRPKGLSSLSDAGMASPLSELSTMSTPSPPVAACTPSSKFATFRELNTAVTPRDRSNSRFSGVEAVA
mmetsp:Transcript_16138/g.56292  ORF Transcript_16138/g.56292 Transcript_16138/m.56292 type:complete len:367 (+) Transcript_16138:652-1752(+)